MYEIIPVFSEKIPVAVDPIWPIVKAAVLGVVEYLSHPVENISPNIAVDISSSINFENLEQALTVVGVHGLC